MRWLAQLVRRRVSNARVMTPTSKASPQWWSGK